MIQTSVKGIAWGNVVRRSLKSVLDGQTSKKTE